MERRKRPRRTRTANISRTPWGRALASIAIWSWSCSRRYGIEHERGSDPHACGLLAHRGPEEMDNPGMHPALAWGVRCVVHGSAQELPIEHVDPRRRSENP